MPKWFLTSRGVMGPLFAIGAIVLGAYGVEFNVENQALVLNQVDAVAVAVVALIGSVVGIYGRVKASGGISALPARPRL